MAFFIRILVTALLLGLAVPYLALGLKAFDPMAIHLPFRIWVLPTLNSLLLAGGTALCAGIIGVGLAYVLSHYKVPFKDLWILLLLLPLAFPPYVMAFIQVGLFDQFGISIRYLLGGIWVLTLVLYPYVFLMTYAGFKTLGKRSIEVGQSLGFTPFEQFKKVTLPMVRPWILSAVVIVSLESLADFGAMSILTLPTLSTQIYHLWFGYFSLEGACRLAGILAVIALLLYKVEANQREKKLNSEPGRAAGKQVPQALTGKKRLCVQSLMLLIVSVAVVIPVGQLLVWSSTVSTIQWQLYSQLGLNTLIITVIATTVCVSLAFLLSYLAQNPPAYIKVLLPISLMGYAIPGSVIAIGVIIMLSFGASISTLFSLTICGMVVGLTMRFLSVGFRPLHAKLSDVYPSIKTTVQLFNMGWGYQVKKLYSPVLMPTIMVAWILVSMEVLKEMPIQLMTRPFGWDTLSVKLYELTSEGLWAEAALPSLVLLVIGCIPILITLKKGIE